MKKYFILPAVALTLTVASCTQAEPEPPSAQEAYTRVFIKEFGIIDPNHTWGFTFDRPGSRTIYTNGNEWVNDWWAPQNVTQEEHDLVMAYVGGTDGDHLVTVDIESEEFRNAFHNFFVTHVGSSMEEYSEVGGSTEFAGGEKMNYLHIAEYVEQKEAGLPVDGDENSKWPHVNNFNAAGNSSWEGHMLVAANVTAEMNEAEAQAETQAHGAYDFCYHNSYDGGFYGRYKIVPGSAIPGSNNTLDLYYYLCFDYMVKKLNGDPETGFYVTFQEGSCDEGGDFVANGEPRTEEKMFSGIYLNAEKDSWPKEDAFYTAIGKTTENAKITEVTIHRYNNAKVVEPNNIYDDWVIRLVGNATRKTETPPDYVQDAPNTRTKRVFVEDLAARAEYNIDAGSSDWDFNDVVFDLNVDETSHKATIKLLALGGTLPVYIGTDADHHTAELHSLMGFASDQMINTGDGYTHVPVMVDCGDMEFNPYDYRSVKIFVQVDGALREMTAETGGAPAKICGRTTDQWAPEHVHICKHWPSFRNWVANPTITNWTTGLKDEDTNQSGD